jgi:hypothetical protein
MPAMRAEEVGRPPREDALQREGARLVATAGKKIV